MTNFENETDKTYSQRKFKNRWDALKKEWKAWKKLKGKDTGLGLCLKLKSLELQALILNLKGSWTRCSWG
ncbi:hypothetical protein Gotri_023279 [Gossypium trilobum]|uniref:Myb/SANT-like domain-containing protein n=1 Tax=Gossypium trilobum TaxID=34281 RepID=A0A7J9DJB0_9ROSI|nr:hypothetical protein [Gossypium trilobum]